MSTQWNARSTVSGLTAALSPSTRLMASALGGDKRALERLLCYPKLSADVEQNRVAPALAALAAKLGVKGSSLGVFQAASRSAVQTNTSAAASQAELGSALAMAGVRWCALAGGCLFRQLLPKSKDRPTTRLLILIGEADLGPARQACTATGWRPQQEGQGFDRYLADEGHVWQARNPQGLELELCFRFWGWAPRHVGRDMLERSTPEPDLRANGCRLTAADAYMVTAMRIWATPAPRPLLFWWDLHHIAETCGESLGLDVYREARRIGLQFPVGLSAAITSGLWDHPTHRQVATLLQESSNPEKAALKITQWRGPESVPTSLMVLARLMSGRRTRTGWRALTRSFWAHPGVVEHETPAKWPKPLRRLSHVVKSLSR